MSDDTPAAKMESEYAPPAGDPAALEAAHSELAQVKDHLLRALAEGENIRRRAEKERADTAKYAAGALAKALLPVADTLQRAVQAARAQLEAPELSAPLRGVLEGVLATERLLQQAFQGAGITPITPEGQPFDPNFHRVMTELESPDHAPGTVVQVLQAGYMIHDRLLREAMVAVAKGPDSAQKHHVDAKV